jgi:hypothetical protein
MRYKETYILDIKKVNEHQSAPSVTRINESLSFKHENRSH